MTAIEPALVTSLAATPAVVHGEQLDTVASLDLDSDEAQIDRGWQVRLDDVAADSTWIDRERLDVTVPRGLAAGTHDVIATAPDGRELVLPGALTVTTEPVGLVLAIEDAPGGTGAPVTGTLAAGDQISAFAVARDRELQFVADLDVEWATSQAIGTLGGATGSSVTLTATKVGSGKLVAERSAAGLAAESGELVVIAGPAAQLVIANAGGGSGTPIGDVGGLTTDADGGLSAHAISFDAFGNFTGDVPVAWSLTGVTGQVPGLDVDTAAVDFATPGVGVLRATHPALGTAATGSLTVIAGRAAALTIVPQ